MNSGYHAFVCLERCPCGNVQNSVYPDGEEEPGAPSECARCRKMTAVRVGPPTMGLSA